MSLIGVCPLVEGQCPWPQGRREASAWKHLYTLASTIPSFSLHCDEGRRMCYLKLTLLQTTIFCLLPPDTTRVQKRDSRKDFYMLREICIFSGMMLFLFSCSARRTLLTKAAIRKYKLVINLSLIYTVSQFMPYFPGALHSRHNRGQ